MPNTRKRAAGAEESPAAKPGRRGAATRGGVRTLIAALRVTNADLQLVAAVQPYIGAEHSASELAYRIWQRGLETVVAEVATVGGALPHGLDETLVATRAAQRLVAVLPLLQRTGKIQLLRLLIEVSAPHSAVPTEEIDASATSTIAELGGNEFL